MKRIFFIRLAIIWSCFNFAILVGFLYPTVSFSIPNQLLNPHSDDPPKISWQQNPGIPNTVNHLHIKDVNIAIINNLGFQHNNGEWVGYAVWDDRFYRYADANNDILNDLWDRFGHGYTDPVFRPRYIYANDVPNQAQALVDEAMSLWNTRAKNEGEENRTAPDGTPLKTSVVFQNVIAGAYELLVDFLEGFQEIRNAVAEWILSAAQIVGYPIGQEPTPPTLMFETTPTSTFDVVQAGWQISTDGLPLNDPDKVYMPQTNAFNTAWSSDKTPEILFNNVDFDYLAPDGTQYEGNEAVFQALGLTVIDSWGGFTLNAVNTFDIFEVDFFSVALHEWGHVIGLLHSNDGIMAADAPFTMNHLSQFIDNDNAFGAAALYSYPAKTPEPSTLLLLGSGLAGLAGLGRKRLFNRAKRFNTESR